MLDKPEDTLLDVLADGLIVGHADTANAGGKNIYSMAAYIYETRCKDPTCKTAVGAFP